MRRLRWRREQVRSSRSDKEKGGAEEPRGTVGPPAFGWGHAQTGVLAAAAVAGAAVGFAANYGRRMIVQGLGATAGDWFDIAEGRASGDAGPVRQDRSDGRRSDLDAFAPADEAQACARQARAPGGECRLSGAARGEFGARRRRAQRRARLYQDLSLRARDDPERQPGMAGARPRFPLDDHRAYADGGGRGLSEVPRPCCRTSRMRSSAR